MEREAYELILSGKFEEAIDILEELKKENRITKNSLFNLALSYLKVGKLEEALEVAEELTEKWNEERDFLFLKGVILRRMGKLIEAKKIFKKLGFNDLADSIPEPVKRKLPDIRPQENIKDMGLTAEIEELIPSEESLETEIKEVIEIPLVNGYIRIPRKHFVAYVTTSGEISEGDNELELTGKGRIYLSTKPRNIEIAVSQGEKVISLENIDIKVEKGEKIFYSTS